MFRFVLAGMIALLTASFGLGQDGAAKRELRYRFEKGGKLTFALAQKMHVKLDEVPEAFQGILTEEPFDSAFEGEAALEVKEVSDQGVATLAGKFQKIKAKGSFVGQDFDFSYDRAKEGEPKGGEKDGGQGGYNPEEIFRRLAGADLKLEIDSLGKIKAAAGGSGATEQASLMFNMARLTGQFPKEKVGVGDSWKNADLIALPQLPFKVRVRSENAFEKMEKVGEADCAVIRSKISAGTEGGDAKEEEQPEFPIKLKTQFTGEGKGLMRFALDAGRLVDNETNLDLKLAVTFPDQEDGEGTTIKGTFKLEQTLKVSRP